MIRIGRTTVYNQITTPELLEAVELGNRELLQDFIDHLITIDRSPATIKQYRSTLNIFFVWNLQYNQNKFFPDLKKRELSRFQSHATNEWKWSPKRIKFAKSALSSLSNYIETILDEEEEFENFKSIVRKIENPPDVAVREKTIIPDEEVDRLLETLVSQDKYEQACAVALAAYSGMRMSELIQMKATYFTLDKLGGSGLWMTPKIRTKGKGTRGKLLNKYVMYDFQKYYDLWMNNRKENGLDSEWLFVSKSADTWNARKDLSHWYNELSEILGMPFYFHCLRHYTCTKLNRLNLPSDVIQAFFGWESPDMIKIYNDAEATDEFDKYFSKDGIRSAKRTTL